MVQKRLDAAIKRARVDLTSADITSGHFLGELRYSEISAQCKPDQWKTAIVELERSLRRAIQFGFTSQELLRSKNDYRAQLLQAVRESNTRDSKQLTAEIISSLNDWRVLLSPKQQWEVLGPMLDTIQPDEVNRAFAEYMGCRSSAGFGHRKCSVEGYQPGCRSSDIVRLPAELYRGGAAIK
jgi:zinc protease